MRIIPLFLTLIDHIIKDFENYVEILENIHKVLFQSLSDATQEIATQKYLRYTIHGKLMRAVLYYQLNY